MKTRFTMTAAEAAERLKEYLGKGLAADWQIQVEILPTTPHKIDLIRFARRVSDHVLAKRALDEHYVDFPLYEAKCFVENDELCAKLAALRPASDSLHNLVDEAMQPIANVFKTGDVQWKQPALGKAFLNEKE